MNRDETIALWQACEDARSAALAKGKDENEAHADATAMWNSWASDLLSRRAELEKAGTWERDSYVDFRAVRFAIPTGTEQLQTSIPDGESSEYDIRTVALASLDIRFDGWIFAGDAQFEEAQFTRQAWFARATFNGSVSFYEAQFCGDIGFRSVEFRGFARFDGMQVEGD